MLVIGGTGLAWPMGLAVFASVRSDLTHPPVGQGKWRSARIAAGWPDFTAPWPVPVVLVVGLGIVTVLVFRRRRLVRHVLSTLAFAWLCVGGGVTTVGSMYAGAEHWPVWQVSLGVHAVVVGCVLWILNRRREDRLLAAARGATGVSREERRSGDTSE